MRLYTFTTEGQPHLGAEQSPFGELVHLHAIDPAIPDSLLEFIRGGPEVHRLARQVMMASPSSVYQLADVSLAAPLARPGKILCSGINYRSINWKIRRRSCQMNHSFLRKCLPR
jgi:acylpyruvate hydrolase